VTENACRLAPARQAVSSASATSGLMPQFSQ
jgi:hypothetical protein